MDSNSLPYTKWNCKYHITFASKYRREIAYGKIIETEIGPDYVYMLVEIPLSISASYFVGT